MGGTVNAKTVRATLGAARVLGLDDAALASAHGMSDALRDVDARVPHTAWLALWRDMIRLTGNESVGLEAAVGLPWGHFDVIDYLVGTSEDFGGALRRLERYFTLVTTGVVHTLEEHDDTVHLVRRYAPGCHTRLLAPTEFALANVVLRTRAPLGVAWRPLEVRFAGPAPSNDAAHRRLFGCPIVFEADDNVMIIDRATLALPMLRPDPSLTAVLERHADMLVAQLRADDRPDDHIERILLEGLREGDLSIARAARRLGTSVRSLQRTLRGRGHTFDALLDRTRRGLAQRYLDDPTLSIQEVAHLLAFGDLRGFYRAFRRWEGCAPGEFRRWRAT